jgi:hypothetical protein
MDSRCHAFCAGYTDITYACYHDARLLMMSYQSRETGDCAQQPIFRERQACMRQACADIDDAILSRYAANIHICHTPPRAYYAIIFEMTRSFLFPTVSFFFFFLSLSHAVEPRLIFIYALRIYVISSRDNVRRYGIIFQINNHA